MYIYINIYIYIYIFIHIYVYVCQIYNIALFYTDDKTTKIQIKIDLVFVKKK